jgi:hypothetical protein
MKQALITIILCLASSQLFGGTSPTSDVATTSLGLSSTEQGIAKLTARN